MLETFRKFKVNWDKFEDNNKSLKVGDDSLDIQRTHELGQSISEIK